MEGEEIVYIYGVDWRIEGYLFFPDNSCSFIAGSSESYGMDIS